MTDTEFRRPLSEAEALSIMPLARELASQSEWKDVEFDAAKTYEEILRWTQMSIRSPDLFFLRCAIRDNIILGVVAATLSTPFFSSTPVAFDHILYVRKDARRLRIGPTLVRDYVEWARSHGAKEVMMTITSEHSPALVRFFARSGFRVTGTAFRKTL